MRNKLCGYSLFIYRMLAVTSFLCTSGSLIRMESVCRTLGWVTQPWPCSPTGFPAPPPLLRAGLGGSARLGPGRISIPVLSFLTHRLLFVRSQEIQILVALIQCIALLEKLCNYCDIFYLIYFLLKCIACDSEPLDYFITVIDFQLL